MSYLNPLLAYGLPRLARDAASAGVCGFIVPDLPHDESQEFSDALASTGLALVQMVTPVTSPERLARVAAASQGFVYAVTMTGTTGRSTGAATDLSDYLARVRAAARVPVCAGFGIRTREQVEALRGMVDGVGDRLGAARGARARRVRTAVAARAALSAHGSAHDRCALRRSTRVRARRVSVRHAREPCRYAAAGAAVAAHAAGHGAATADLGDGSVELRAGGSTTGARRAESDPPAARGAARARSHAGRRGLARVHRLSAPRLSRVLRLWHGALARRRSAHLRRQRGRRELVAAPWIPDDSITDVDGKVRPQFMTAALDCPGLLCGAQRRCADAAGRIHRARRSSRAHGTSRASSSAGDSRSKAASTASVRRCSMRMASPARGRSRRGSRPKRGMPPAP